MEKSIATYLEKIAYSEDSILAAIGFCVLNKNKERILSHGKILVDIVIDESTDEVRAQVRGVHNDVIDGPPQPLMVLEESTQNGIPKAISCANNIIKDEAEALYGPITQAYKNSQTPLMDVARANNQMWDKRDKDAAILALGTEDVVWNKNLKTYTVRKRHYKGGKRGKYVRRTPEEILAARSKPKRIYTKRKASVWKTLGPNGGLPAKELDTRND